MCGGGNPIQAISDIATDVFQPIEKAVVQPIANVATQVFEPLEKAIVQPISSALDGAWQGVSDAATSVFQPIGQAIGIDQPPAPPPAPAAPVAVDPGAPPAAARADTYSPSDPTSNKAKIGRLKARGGLLIDKTTSVTGAANATTGGLNIPN